MAGFAVLVQPTSSARERASAFQSLTQGVAEFKHLNLPAEQAVGAFCTAAKFDAPASLHRGIVRDEATGSWLLAAGTVVCIADEHDAASCLDNLLRDYIENGTDALQRYEGQFALVIYDGHTETLSIISDPMGHFSIFYGARGNQTFIATSALAVARQVGSRPDVLAIECFLRTSRAYGETTLWQDVKRLPPATVHKISPDKVETFEYWTLTVDETLARLSFDDALDYAADMMSRIFKRFLQQEGQVWADLTGGLDSRLVTMFIAKVGTPFIAYSVGPAEHPDVKVAQLICQVMGWEHRHMPMQDDWEREQCAWLEIAACKGDARLNVLQLTYILRGQQQRSLTCPVHVLGLGADEWKEHVYWKTALFSIGREELNYDHLLDSMILSPIPSSILRQDRTREARAELKAHLARLASKGVGLSTLAKTDLLYLRHRHPTHGGAYLSATAGIMRSLIPFCCKESETWGFSLDDRWRINYHHGFVRALLERENPRLASIATQKGGPGIPVRVTNLDQFGPLWKKIVNEATTSLSRKLLGKSITPWPQPHYAEYPLPTWRKGWLTYVVSKGLLAPTQMYSGALYRTDVLQALVAQAESEDFKHEDFLGRVITVEMALRAVGTCIE